MTADDMVGSASTVSEMIEVLEEIQEKYGDLPVKHRKGGVLGKPYFNHFPESDYKDEHIEVTSL